MRSLLLLPLPILLAACSGGSDDTAATDTGADSGTDTDSDSAADSGTDTDSDSAADSGTDTDSDSGSSPLAEDSVRFTYKGYTSTIDCAAAYDREAEFEGAFYQIECAVADDRSGSSSWSGSFTLKLFNPEARAYTADDLARYSTGGFSLFVYRGGGSAPGSLLTSSGYDWSAATFSDVDVAITTFDPASGRVAAEFSFGAVDRAGDAWTVEGRFDEVFVQP